MRDRLTPVLTLAALLCGAVPAGAGIVLVDAGVVCPAIRETVDRVPAPDTEAGHVDLIGGDLTFDLQTGAVPLMRHLSFGLRVRNEGDAPVEAVVVVVHPPFGARRVARESWAHDVPAGDTALNLFTFDHPYEMVPGRWTFSFEVGGETALTVPFDVGAPGAEAAVDAVCLGALAV
ncbi:DUF3859 domain-containing protein [Jannaschia sp. LMIT008]|uniref:DUF3859 domain-containing protein n=1 Tax=Jannaschia maritima TaxID=3032585 RepID=UPI0028114C60|nr:DUF3859 domain-containing protein [Jannaschia sp. LMIT008]